MRWWFSNNEETGLYEEEAVVSANYSRGQKILLQDTPAKFADGPVQERQRKLISRDDFSWAHITSIPCFRDAGMVGFSSMFVVGSVMFLYHKSPMRATNWAMGGLLLGSVVGWEQCRFKRRKSFQTAELAKQTVAQKEKPMMKPRQHDPRLVHQWDEPKPWYKFW